MEFTQLKNKIAKGETLPNLLIFTGEEVEVQRQYIERIDKHYKRVDKVSQLPALMQFRGLLDNSDTYVTSDPEVMKLTEENINSLTKRKRLIIQLEKVDKRSSFYKTYKKNITEFNRFTEEQLIPYITKKLSMTNETAIAVAIYCNNEISRIDMELDKLGRLDIPTTIKQVQENITPPLEDAIFEMIDGAMKKDTHTAMAILDDMLELGESGVKIISLLYTKVRHIFMIQSLQQFNDKQIAEKTGISYWQVKMTRPLCNVISLEELIERLELIQRYEVYMKTGQVDIEIGIQYLMTRMIQT